MQFMISVLDDGNNMASPEEDAAIDTFNEKLKAGGQWIFAGGLGEPGPASVIDNRGSKPLVTDGPYIESKEYIAGFWIIEATDRDTALALAHEGSRACNRRVEVRPFL